MRLSESLYCVKSVEENGMLLDELSRLAGFASSESSCLPVGIHVAKQSNTIEESHLWLSGREFSTSADSLSGHSMYVDPDISSELHNKVNLNV